MKFAITMKPTAMSRKAGKTRRPEYLTTVEASSRDEAITAARNAAQIEGFAGYAITAVKELK